MPAQSLRITVYLFSLVFALSGIGSAQQDQKPAAPKKATGEQEVRIRALIEQLVLVDRDAPDPKKLMEKMRKGQVEESLPPMSPELQDKPDPAYKKRFNGCHEAFKKLSEIGILAFPYLVEHLDDKRQSIPFRNHSLQQSVGDACYWNIYYQLHDTPNDYSFYGYQRQGRDGKPHVKPYWRENIFDEAGGLKKWLGDHHKLSYVEMQLECLNWLLEREKQIGASDAESYFENILPLEVRILERKLEAGANVGTQLERLRAALREKDTRVIPEALLPDKAEQGRADQPATRLESKPGG